MADPFFAAYDRWHQDCLAEFNAKFGPGSHPGVRKLYEAPDDGNYNPDDLVEFSEDGSAYPHSRAGGTNYIPRCVTPWADSPHYVE